VENEWGSSVKTYSEFHDGFLEGLRTDRDAGVVHVYLTNHRKVRITAVLSGVSKLKAEGFREGNIILDVSTRDSDEVTLADVANLYDSDSIEEPNHWRHTLMKKIREESLQIFEVNPSYGAQLLILAQTIEFVPGKEL
jgi:hypothetical protein